MVLQNFQEIYHLNITQFFFQKTDKEQIQIHFRNQYNLDTQSRQGFYKRNRPISFMTMNITC